MRRPAEQLLFVFQKIWYTEFILKILAARADAGCIFLRYSALYRIFSS
ncbi:hypothetical protein HMPREF1548_06697 [Clostridium sp. KLE 1755]|nr:hypothetical protein HMPREF1548_06697 [Clostridium sp. KLE 1755]